MMSADSEHSAVQTTSLWAEEGSQSAASSFKAESHSRADLAGEVWPDTTLNDMRVEVGVEILSFWYSFGFHIWLSLLEDVIRGQLKK